MHVHCESRTGICSLVVSWPLQHLEGEVVAADGGSGTVSSDRLTRQRDRFRPEGHARVILRSGQHLPNLREACSTRRGVHNIMS